MKRLIRAQQAAPIDPNDQTKVTLFLNNMAKRIEENFFHALKNKIKYEDILPYALDNNLDEQAGFDFKQAVNMSELLRQINLEIARDKSIYDIVSKYLNQQYKTWANKQQYQQQQYEE